MFIMHGRLRKHVITNELNVLKHCLILSVKKMSANHNFEALYPLK